MNILDDSKFQNFIQSRDLRSNTIRNYRGSLERYCGLLNKAPTELIKEAREDQQNIPWIDDRRITDYFLRFKNYLESENSEFMNGKLEYRSKLNYFRIIKTFYIHYNIDLPKVRIKQREKKKRETIDNIPNHDHITKALELSNIKYRAIIALMASSGIASVDIRNLSIGDFYTSLGMSKPDFPLDISELKTFISENPGYCPMFNGTRVKSDIDYTTFCTPESAKFIVNYIENQNRGSYSHVHNSANDPLFLSRTGKKLDPTAFGRYFRRVNDNAGFGLISKNNGFFSSHKLRKFFTSVLYKNNIPELSIHWYLGHKVPEVTESYFKMSVKTHRKEYERLVPHLTFIEKIREIETTPKAIRELTKAFEEEKIKNKENIKMIIDLVRGIVEDSKEKSDSKVESDFDKNEQLMKLLDEYEGNN